MQENLSQLAELGFPSPFHGDGSIATVKQIVERVEKKEQDLATFQDFSHPPNTIYIEGFIHPFAKLFFHCEVGTNLPKVLPYKEMLDLKEAQENLYNLSRPFEEDWVPL